MSSDFKASFTPKQLRVLGRCLQALFSMNALEPLSWERIRLLKFPELFRREIKVNASGSKLFLTDRGVEALERASETFAEVDSGELWTRADVFGVVRKQYESWLQQRVQPESSQEFIDLVYSELTAKVRRHTYAASVHGIDMEGIDEVPLGELRLVADAQSAVRESGATNLDDLEKEYLADFRSRPCLVGSRKGTSDACRRWFREQAYLAVGMLAVEIGATYERAATNFHLELEFDRPTGGSRAIYLFWDDVDRYLGSSISWWRGQTFKPNLERFSELLQPGAFLHAFKIFQKRGRTDLEDAITKAVYWYGEAHRDPVDAMQFVKYWSCLECLLGGAGEALTENLSLGAVIVLTFGHYRLLEEAEVNKNVRTVKRLYAVRSRAVHRASHADVAPLDVATMSAWAAWVIYNAISFSNAGMRSTMELWTSVRKVALVVPGVGTADG